ncbi:MAG: hypothetical protein WBP85_13500 [Terracidiphilus sp.]
MEPVNSWQPVTDFYKEQQAAQAIDPEAETREMLREIPVQPKRVSRAEEKAPIGIRVFNWYLFCRAGFYLLLLFVIAAYPQSGVSNWLVTTVEHSLPGHASREQAERQREMLRQYGINPDTLQSADASSSEDSEEARQQRQREFVMVCLFVMAGVTAVVAFMWMTRFWRVRWAAMFYAGAFVVKAGVSLFAGWASGVGTQIPADQVPGLVVALAVNGFIFCYLAFWPGVEEWFKEI